ncbi:hypothetical protein PsorP6_017669 [Peronosclerospora sorghi]|uniref:Uncharacterized protein n=1 Tax=Peronosclerospora sorghi TaxID=230839 RepID=A0ACC0WN34_9STRA|nr:hypothetical protein PsorP6_017669 [Peronosclerospora sorghi]
MLDALEDVLPANETEWENVAEQFNDCREAESLASSATALKRIEDIPPTDEVGANEEGTSDSELESSTGGNERDEADDRVMKGDAGGSEVGAVRSVDESEVDLGNADIRDADVTRAKNMKRKGSADPDRQKDLSGQNTPVTPTISAAARKRGNLDRVISKLADVVTSQPTETQSQRSMLDLFMMQMQSDKEVREEERERRAEERREARVERKARGRKAGGPREVGT